ncbi:tail fiber protein [Vibrio phage D479]
MAELRSSTSIGGNLVWHSGNLRFDTQGETIRYSGYKIYTEHDKPDPHTDLTTSVVKRSGDTMTGALRITNAGEQLDLTNTAFSSTDSWISMGNGKADTHYAWQIRYMGTGGGIGSNELRFGSTYGASPKYWQMDHSGNFNYFNGANTYTMLHTGNINNTLDGRYVNTAGDTMTGTLNVPTLHVTDGMIQVDHSGTSSDTLISMMGTMEDSSVMFINNGGGDNILSFTRAGSSDYVSAFYGTARATSDLIASRYVQGSRLYASVDRSSGYFFNDSSTRVSYKGGDFYIQSDVQNTYLYATNTYLGNTSGDNILVRGNKLSGDTWSFAGVTGNFLTTATSEFNGATEFDTSTGFRLKRNASSNTGDDVVNLVVDDGGLMVRVDNDNDSDSSKFNVQYKTGGAWVSTFYVDHNGVSYKGNAIFHAGDYSTLDNRYLNVTGDTMTGILTGTNIRAQNFQTRTGQRLIDTAADNILRIGNSTGAETHTRVHGSGSSAGRKLSVWHGGVDQWVFNDGYHPNADKWTTARTLTLAGDVSGSVSMDGTANVSLTATVADDSHNHTSLTSVSQIQFQLPGSSDGGFIEMKGGSNSGYMRFSTWDDNGTEYMEFGDYDTSATSSTFTRWLKLVRGSAEFAGTLSTTGNTTVGGDLTINGGDLTINSNNGGITYNDSSKYWLKTATNWGLYWNTSSNSFEYRGSGTARAAVDLDSGNITTNGEVQFAEAMVTKASVSYNSSTKSIDFKFV